MNNYGPTQDDPQLYQQGYVAPPSQQPAMQYPPQPQTLQQPAAYQQQSSTTTSTFVTAPNHGSQPQSAPLQPPAIDYTTLMQAQAQPPVIDYTSLMQAQPQSSVIDYTQLVQSASSVPQAPVSQTVTQSTTSIVKHGHAGEGSGRARKMAEARGQAAVAQFEQQVDELISKHSNCPNNMPWYKATTGYLCGDGHHFIFDEEIDRYILGTAVRWPRFMMTNDITGEGLGTHPPQVDLWQPMHRAHAEMMNARLLNGFMTYAAVEEFGICDCAKRVNRELHASSDWDTGFW